MDEHTDMSNLLTSLRRERYAPVVAGCSVAVCWYLWNRSIPDHMAKEFLAAVLSAAAICAGFLTTAVSVLMTMGSTAVGRRLRKRNRLPDLFAYLRKAIFSCLLLCALCIAGFFVHAKDEGISTLPSAAIIGMITYSGAAFARVIPILISIFEQMCEPPEKNG